MSVKMSKKIEKLIVKYLTNAATAADLDILSEWINEPEHERLFKSYVETYYAVICSMKKNDYQKTVEKLLRTIRKEKSFLHQLKTNVIYKYAAAASVVLMITFTIFLNKDNSTNLATDPIIVDNQIQTGTYKATLTLASGEELSLAKGNTIQTQNASSNGEEIVYSNISNDVNIYNHLTIPRGGQFMVKLSDGTKIWLNSESQLKYPVSFIEGGDREVQLLYGEAYFDVSPSTNHNGSKFKVLSGTQSIEVLGTKFNLKAYKDESVMYTTLVEGKVAIMVNDTKEILKPNEQATFNNKTKSLEVRTVDVFDEISWKDGVFSFNDMPLKKIMSVLSRWYDFDVNFENKNLESVNFNGVLRKNYTFEQIMSIINNTNDITYEITGKTVIFK